MSEEDKIKNLYYMNMESNQGWTNEQHLDFIEHERRYKEMKELYEIRYELVSKPGMMKSVKEKNGDKSWERQYKQTTFV